MFFFLVFFGLFLRYPVVCRGSGSLNDIERCLWGFLVYC